MNRFRILDILIMLIITIWGITQGQVTVFYIIYLFWFQELIRTLVDFGAIIVHKKTFQERFEFLKTSWGNFFLLFIYLIFIVVLFGFMLNWNNPESVGNNMMILVFRNWFFNTNVMLFLVEYIFYRYKTDNSKLKLQLFNSYHIILHTSIIFGAVIQLAVIPKYNIESFWASAMVIAPFLAIKIIAEFLINRKHKAGNNH